MFPRCLSLWWCAPDYTASIPAICRLKTEGEKENENYGRKIVVTVQPQMAINTQMRGLASCKSGRLDMMKKEWASKDTNPRTVKSEERKHFPSHLLNKNPWVHVIQLNSWLKHSVLLSHLRLNHFHNLPVKYKVHDWKDIVLAETKNQMYITFNEYVPSLHWPVLGISGILQQLHFLGHQAKNKHGNNSKGKPEFTCI